MFIVYYLYIDTEAVLKRLASLATEVSGLFVLFVFLFGASVFIVCCLYRH